MYEHVCVCDLLSLSLSFSLVILYSAIILSLHVCPITSTLLVYISVPMPIYIASSSLHPTVTPI